MNQIFSGGRRDDNQPPLPLRPLVSVLTLLLNQATWLRANLSSVGLQDYEPIQRIVADGGPTDSSVEILSQWVGTNLNRTYRAKRDNRHGGHTSVTLLIDFERQWVKHDPRGIR
jgi:hypothetical protein